MTSSPIQHVERIVTENQGYDNYLARFPGGLGTTMAFSPNPPPSAPDDRQRRG